ncbi:hypothetical protein VaNZ11_002527, partial [Volvox africanus]
TMNILACFGRARPASTTSKRQLRQPSWSVARLDEHDCIVQTTTQSVQAASEVQQEADPCSESPFRSGNIAPIAEDEGQYQTLNKQELAPELFMFHASSSSNKSTPYSHHGLTTSNPLANDHLEGHLLPAGLDLATLHHLIDSVYVSSLNHHNHTQESHGSLQGPRVNGGLMMPGGGGGSGGQERSITLSLQQRQQLQQVLPEVRDAPDLRSLTYAQLVRLCQPEDIVSDLAGLKLIGTGRRSVTCQARWRGAHVAVKLTSSLSLDPNTSAIIKQALVSKALAHPNVLQHYSVRCCRFALSPIQAAVAVVAAVVASLPHGHCTGNPSAAGQTAAGATTAAVNALDCATVSSASAPGSRAAVAEECDANGGGGDSTTSTAAAAAAAVVHHLSGPTATNNVVQNDSASTGVDSAAEQISDLIVGTYGGSATSLPPPSSLLSGCQIGLGYGHSKAGAGGSRVLKAPREQFSRTIQDPAASQVATGTAAAPPEPARRQGCATREQQQPLSHVECRGTAETASPRTHPAAETGRSAAAAEASTFATPSHIPAEEAEVGAGATAMSAAATAVKGTAASVSHYNAATAAATTRKSAGTHGAAAVAVGPGTVSPGSLSFNSYEGFGDPFGSLRHALTLDQIAALLSAAEGDYLTVIIMEYADKSTLQQAVQRGLFVPNRVWNGRVALRALLRTSLELACALQHLHSRGVVHGSLRPANVLLKSSNIDRRGFTAKVSNFSLARVCFGDYDDLVLEPVPLGLLRGNSNVAMAAPEAAGAGAAENGRSLEPRRSSTGGVDVAALPFWSPEQLCGVVGKASDVYAFGVTLYFMSTGSLPYAGIPTEEVVRGVAAGELRPRWPDDDGDNGGVVTAAGAAGPEAAAVPSLARSPLRDLCALCWQPDPRARPTFAQVCVSLQAIEHAVRQQLRKQVPTTGSL